ncbi:shikimate dehydrogenase [Catalinimonas alkaloidigena]|uniref:Shikimate dehydrogenase n=1 Tax=Catalinimonas alkaloidigena TaxID=1075417 RepID=A0A1G9E1L3_9BACT|nr:shikimate dehydrogenase [Catalinimonas alkaloidigena]SDK70011.1 shikimate dehydrogenase [Catalinimonas alkaloidigena]
MRKFGLIGYPLTHSFSKKYFTEKFAREGIAEASYELYELPDIERFPALCEAEPTLMGINVTIPHKKAVMPFLDALAPSAQKVGAVNVIRRFPDGRNVGYNSDYDGFRLSLERFLPDSFAGKALILGTGGASQAVRAVLDDLGLAYHFVSRQATADFTYKTLTPEILQAHRLIINTTPLGTWPNVAQAPDLPYEAFTSQHYLFDLVYNPEVTECMHRAKAQGAQTKNGLEMLHLQAEKAWEIWNEPV